MWRHEQSPRPPTRLIRSLLAGLLVTFSVPTVVRAAAPPPAVTVTPITVQDVAPVYTFIGHVIAIQSVQIVPRVTAFIDKVAVKEGSDVKAGEVLFELQKAQYQAALQSAKAQLASAQAALRQSTDAYQRSAKLNKQGFEAQANLDQAIAARDKDQASVEAAQAAVVQAGLNLSYCTITSPIGGQIGAVTLTKGNLVTPTTPSLATVNELDPIRVVFSVSDRVVVSVEQRTHSTRNQISAGLAITLQLPDGSDYQQPGKISFTGNEVDPATGTVSVYADFPNPRRLLLPGAYVNVKVRSAKPEERPLVPAAALQTSQSGSFVLVVGKDNKVSQQTVVLGRQIAQDFIVDKGLAGGERVIIAGVQKVRPGETVNPIAAPQTNAAQAAPTEPNG